MPQPSEQLKRFQDVKFWKSLCPELTISEDSALNASDVGRRKQACPVRESDWESCKELIDEDGYFVYDSCFNKDQIELLADCFDRLKREEIEPIFCFVYDEFWTLLIEMKPLLDDLIGDHDILPSVWAWFVEPDNQTGFSPHRDQVRETSVDDDDHLDYLTIWIPLTDLNHLSSSICVLPASLDPDYEEGTSRVCVEDLQDVRSLQASKGSVLCWTVCLAHWGTKQASGGESRKSVGFYVQRSEAECLVPPPMDFDQPLALESRLALIGTQIIDYSRDSDDEQLRFAQKLVELAMPKQPSGARPNH